jgi:hypothetical protein
MIEIPMIIFLNIFFTFSMLLLLFANWMSLICFFWKTFDSESANPSIKSIILSTVITILTVLIWLLIYFKIVVFV